MTIEVRRFQHSDFEGMMDLVRACYQERAEPPDWWRWRHLELAPQPTTIFLAVDRKQIVGMRPMAFFDYFLLGKSVKGSLFSAVMVHPDYRRQGIFSLLVKTCIDEAWNGGAVFVNTMPNDISYRGFMKLGWKDPGDRRLLVRPLDMVSLAKQEIRPAWLGNILALGAQGIVRVLSRPLKRSYFRIAPVDRLDRAVEDLAMRFGSHFPGLILRRSHEWFTWRYRLNPWNRYRCFEAHTPEGNVAGIAVVNSQTRSRVNVGFVVELLGEGSDVRRALIVESVNLLKESGSHVAVTVVSAPDIVSDYRKEGFYPVPSTISPKKFHTVYYTHPDHFSAFEPVRTIDRWYQTLGDWDGI